MILWISQAHGSYGYTLFERLHPSLLCNGETVQAHDITTWDGWDGRWEGSVNFHGIIPWKTPTYPWNISAGMKGNNPFINMYFRGTKGECSSGLVFQFSFNY